MTKKHFKAIASHFNYHLNHTIQTGEEELLYSLAIDLAQEFEKFYERFDQVKFLEACGFKKNPE